MDNSKQEVVVGSNILTRKQKYYATSFYKSLSIGAQGGSTLALNTGQTNALFELPAANSYKLNSMSIQFTTPSVFAPDGSYAGIYRAHCPYIQQVQLFTSDTNILIVQANGVDQYTKIASPLYLDYKERAVTDGFLFTSSRSGLTIPASAANDQVPQVAGLTPIVYPAVQGQDANQAAEDWRPASIARDAINPTTADPVAPDIDPQTAAQFEYKAESVNAFAYNEISPGTVGGAVGTANALRSVTYNIKLSDLLGDSIFNITKDLFLAKVYLKIIFAPADQIWWQALPVASAQLIKMTGATIPVTITGLALNLQIQANQDLVSFIRTDAMEQKDLVYPNIDQITIPGVGIQQQPSYKITSQVLESRLLKTYYGLFYQLSQNLLGTQCVSSNSYQTAADSTDTAVTITKAIPSSGKMQNVYVTLNGNTILNLDCVNNQDYWWTKQLVDGNKNSLCGITAYKNIGVIPIYFDSDSKDIMEYDGQTLKGMQFQVGLNEALFTYSVGINATTVTALAGAQLNNILFAVTLKKIYILNGQLSFLPYA